MKCAAKTTGPWIVPPNDLGNEIRIISELEHYKSVLSTLQELQSEYPEFNITILNGSGTKDIEHYGADNVFLIFRRDGRVISGFSHKEYSKKELKDIIVAQFPPVEHAGSSIRTTVFDDNSTVAIYNDGDFFCMGYDGDRDILELARQRKIDLYFEQYETNYSCRSDDEFVEYPKKMSKIFEWAKENKENKSCILKRVKDDIIRPPQYKDGKS